MVLRGLVFSLAGDVFLMLDPPKFEAGLGSFLVAHLCYIAGFAVVGVSGAVVGVALPGVVAAAIVIGRPVLAGVGPSALRVPVALYMAVISAMVLAAAGSGRWWAVAGALLFYASDACIALNKFVQPFAAAKLVIIVTYHLAQALLVWSLTS